MTRASIIAFTTLVWTAGFAATGALYSITKPNAPPPRIAFVETTPAPAPRALVAQSEPVIASRTIVLPTFEIRSSLPRAVSPPAAPPLAVNHHCSDWRPLEQGASSVQICD